MSPEQRKRWMAARYKHGGFEGGAERPEHYVWRTMMARCYKESATSYSQYGGRGIRVCKRWHSYINFFRDMGERPSAKHSLDRIRVNGDYKPSNCRWATHSEQQRNKTTTRIYSNGSFTGTLVECAALVGISKELAHWRWKTHGAFVKGQQWRELRKV